MLNVELDNLLEAIRAQLYLVEFGSEPTRHSLIASIDAAGCTANFTKVMAMVTPHYFLDAQEEKTGVNESVAEKLVFGKDK